MNNLSQDLSIPCSECSAGQMHRRFLTYLTYLGDELISVPDFPAWICDICGRREYDLEALSHLSLLLNPNAGRPARKVRQARRSSTHKKAQRPAPPE